MKRIRRSNKMNAIVFGTPEKQTSSSGESFFQCKLAEPGYSIPHDLEWNRDDQKLIPVLSIQKLITELRSSVLKLLLENKSIFRNPPTPDSLHAITPPWGILIRSNSQLEWSSVNKWTINDSRLKDKNAIVRLVLTGIEISRSRITPVWTLSIVQILPEKTPEGVIDFDFENETGERDEVQSVGFDEIDCDESQVLHLQNPGERKRMMKVQIRELLAKVSDARLAADDAMDRFFNEFDLSEDESDFSDMDSENE